MVTPSRDAASTVSFIDHYCWNYRSLFKEVRHYESFKDKDTVGESNHKELQT